MYPRFENIFCCNWWKCFHYRDRYNLEADIIVSLRDGRWAAIEVKMGQKQIEEAAENLLKLKERVNTDKMGEPSFLMVLMQVNLHINEKMVY